MEGLKRDVNRVKTERDIRRNAVDYRAKDPSCSMVLKPATYRSDRSSFKALIDLDMISDGWHVLPIN